MKSNSQHCSFRSRQTMTSNSLHCPIRSCQNITSNRPQTISHTLLHEWGWGGGGVGCVRLLYKEIKDFIFHFISFHLLLKDQYACSKLKHKWIAQTFLFYCRNTKVTPVLYYIIFFYINYILLSSISHYI